MAGQRREAAVTAASLQTPARRAGALVAVIVTAVVAVLVAALAAVAATRASHRAAVDAAGQEAVDAAVAHVATVLSYDYRRLDDDFRRADALLTPGFRKQYDATAAKAVRPTAIKYKATSQAQVFSGGLVSAEPDRAQVLVFVGQQVANSQLTAPRLDRSRINVTMVRSGDRWLIDALNPF
jgi:Mce-associated membrane protein